MKEYNKLVRDKIPEIIEASAKSCSIRCLGLEEYVVALEQKLNEEVAEYQKDKNLEELADILEVLQALCVAKGHSLEDLEQLRKEKAIERGGFDNRIFLEYVE